MKLDKKLLKKNIEEVAEYDFSNNKVFGSAYWVFQKDKVVYEKGFGKVSLDTDTPVTDKTIFRLASMTKPITAIATLILVERGMLSLSELVSKYVPEIEGVHITKVDKEKGCLIDCGEAKNQIKVIHLLTHTSGLGCNIEKDQIAKMTQEDRLTIDNTIKHYIEVGLDFEPGTRSQYSGVAAFEVLTKIIEKVTNMDFLCFLKKEIFEPCNMVDTTFIPAEEQWGRMIEVHNKIDGKNGIAKIADGCIFSTFPCEHYVGGGSLISTLHDYSEFAKMLLNKGRAGDKQIISRKTFKLLHTPHVSKEVMPGAERWGLGVRVIVKKSYKKLPVGAFGWSGAYGSHFWIDPKNKVAAVFMKNSLFDGGAANESARNFEKAVKKSFSKGLFKNFKR